ncbi:DciA family protein [Dyella sp. 20L07]|uniref:DciA family protein n=1 Tax=Dyella sp. 20L07 TaxID=3384240 RepID=UPI003D26C64F
MQYDAPKPSRRIGSGLKAVTEYGPIASLARKARELDALDRALRQTLPSPLREQVRFANLKDGRLIFLAPSPALAARLRLLQTQILTTARTIGTYASSVTVKVVPLSPAEIVPDQTKPLSPAAASHLRAAAASTSDPELRELFLELASVAKISDSRPDGTG